METTKNPYARFFGLLSKLPYLDKEDIIWKYSHTVTISLSEFYNKMPDAYNNMIRDMQKMANEIEEYRKVSKNDNVVENEKRKFRSFIFSQFNDYGIVVKNKDYSEINRIIQTWAKTDKTMKTMSLDELKKLSKQVHKIVQWHKNKQEQLKQIASFN